MADHQQQAMFGAGCFWGVELTFSQTPGVTATQVGYSGGKLDHPGYEDVCSGTTGHAEVVHVTFNPEQISYQTLVEKFFALHDPTQLNRQGPDIGQQYRSVIFYYNPEQEATARKVRTALTQAGSFKHPIATAIEPAAVFWPAEEYHQQYLKKRGGPACR